MADSAPGGPLGAPAPRREGPAKVTGTARYAAEYAPPGRVYGWPVPAAIARGRITAIDVTDAMDQPGALAVLTHQNAPRLADAGDPTLLLLQAPLVRHHGELVALAVADNLQSAQEMAAAVRVEFAEEPHDVELSADHPRAYRPEQANGGFPADRERGDFDAVYPSTAVRADQTYAITALHNHPMEPHAATASWSVDGVHVHDSSQGTHAVQDALCALFDLPADRVTVESEHVGGGFGCKGTPRPHVVLAVMAAREVGRPVTVSLYRAAMAAVVGHRAATEQRVRLGADTNGRIAALAHEVSTYSSTVKEFVEQAATPSRSMYLSPHSRTTHRLTRLDVPTPSWKRAPGECSGMYALESAMDELADACGVDPVDLRLRNDTDREPDSDRPFSSRHLARCLTEGADRFGWSRRDPRPAVRREGRLLVGTGVAASGYPAEVAPSQARAIAEADGRFLILVNATDIGTGARTVMAQVAADALGVEPDRVRIEIGSSALPRASLAGGSSGTASWGWAVHKACRALLRRLDDHEGSLPAAGLSATADTADDVADRSTEFARRAFGAQFAEVTVDVDSGEVRVRRLLGVFATGRILNARTARSQFIGGMTMGLSMALMEHSTMDPAFGDFAERDLASYHVATAADVRDVEAVWLEEEDEQLNPMGSKGIGEIGIVGTAAAVANAVHHATGVRVRRLPLLPDAVLAGLG